MSSVLIKGMEMPECCDSCCFAYWSIFHQTAMCSRNDKPCFANFSIEYRTKRPDWCPLEEAKPVRHGKWIQRGTTNIYSCSECKFEQVFYGVKLPNYCNVCGTKMDNVESENG